MNAGKMCLLFLSALLTMAGVGADNLAAIQHYNQAVDLANSGKYDEALQQVDRALQENPNFTLALVTRGGILNVLGKYQDAINESDKAIAIDPRNAAALNNKAYALIHLGKYAEGLTSAEKATTLDPNLTEAWVNKGTALIRLGRYQEALSASEKALSVDPGSEEARKNRNEAHSHLPATPAAAPLHVSVIGGVSLGMALLARRS
jgi:tetratricopeptide (TPR) repeat protein